MSDEKENIYYKSESEVKNDIKRLQIILNARELFEQNLYKSEDDYMNFYKKRNLLMYFYNKLKFSSKYSAIMETIDFTTDIDFNILKEEVNNFIDVLNGVEKSNIELIKKFSFKREDLFIWDHINKIKPKVIINKDLENEILSDIEFLENNITKDDSLMFKMYLKKINKLARINGNSSAFDFLIESNNLLDNMQISEFTNEVKHIFNRVLVDVENTKNSFVFNNSPIEFDQEIQDFVLDSSFKILNENIFEVFEILKENVIIGDKCEIISDPKLLTLIVRDNDNSLEGFINYLKVMSSAINLQFSKYYNHYEFSQINELETEVNFWFMYFIVKEVIVELINDEQKQNVKNYFNTVVFNCLTTSLSAINMAINTSEFTPDIILSEIQSLFDFENVFIDSKTFDAFNYVQAFKDNSALKQFISMCIGFKMFENFDNDDSYINQIENYYQFGSVNNTYENAKKMDINLLDQDLYVQVIKNICKRIMNG